MNHCDEQAWIGPAKPILGRHMRSSSTRISNGCRSACGGWSQMQSTKRFPCKELTSVFVSHQLHLAQFILVVQSCTCISLTFFAFCRFGAHHHKDASGALPRKVRKHLLRTLQPLLNLVQVRGALDHISSLTLPNPGISTSSLRSKRLKAIRGICRLVWFLGGERKAVQGLPPISMEPRVRGVWIMFLLKAPPFRNQEP